MGKPCLLCILEQSFCLIRTDKTCSKREFVSNRFPPCIILVDAGLQSVSVFVPSCVYLYCMLVLTGYSGVLQPVAHSLVTCTCAGKPIIFTLLCHERSVWKQTGKHYLLRTVTMSVLQLSVPKWGTLRSSLLTILSYQRLILLSSECNFTCFACCHKCPFFFLL